eukprot:SAG11_NODE_2364_length_3458_cov_1.827032_3_plen_352_part_00
MEVPSRSQGEAATATTAVGWDVVVLAVPAWDVEAASAEVAPLLADGPGTQPALVRLSTAGQLREQQHLTARGEKELEVSLGFVCFRAPLLPLDDAIAAASQCAAAANCNENPILWLTAPHRTAPQSENEPLHVGRRLDTPMLCICTRWRHRMARRRSQHSRATAGNLQRCRAEGGAAASEGERSTASDEFAAVDNPSSRPAARGCGLAHRDIAFIAIPPAGAKAKLFLCLLVLENPSALELSIAHAPAPQCSSALQHRHHSFLLVRYSFFVPQQLKRSQRGRLRRGAATGGSGAGVVPPANRGCSVLDCHAFSISEPQQSIELSICETPRLHESAPFLAVSALRDAALVQC